MPDDFGRAEPTSDLEYPTSKVPMHLVGDPTFTAAHDGVSPVRPSTASVGTRLHEREHLLSSLRGQFGQDFGFARRLICVEGAPGLGKSALLDAFHVLADDAGLTV